MGGVRLIQTSGGCSAGCRAVGNAILRGLRRRGGEFLEGYLNAPDGGDVANIRCCCR